MPPTVTVRPQLPLQPIVPALLRHVLPKLGPPSRVKRLAQQHHAKPRKAPSARQKMAPGTGVRQRRQGLLEKFDSAMKRQVGSQLSVWRGCLWRIGMCSCIRVQGSQAAMLAITQQHFTATTGRLHLRSHAFIHECH